MKNSLFILVILLLLGACSTLPKPEQPQAKVNADNTLKLAQDYELSGRYANAIDSYTFAQEIYQSFADTEGELYALSGLARIELSQGAPDAAQEFRAQMQDLVELVEPKQAPILLLYDLHVLHRTKDYAQISQLAVPSRDMSPSQRMQVLSYAVQADAYLQAEDRGKTAELKKLIKKQAKKPLRKRLINPQILSEAYYSLAYHYYTHKDFTGCLSYLKGALKLDYVYGNFASLGYSTWLEGKARAGLGQTQAAISLLLKARQIFQSASNLEMITQTDSDLEALNQGGLK